MRFGSRTSLLRHVTPSAGGWGFQALRSHVVAIPKATPLGAEQGFPLPMDNLPEELSVVLLHAVPNLVCILIWYRNAHFILDQIHENLLSLSFYIKYADDFLSPEPGEPKF